MVKNGTKILILPSINQSINANGIEIYFSLANFVNFYFPTRSSIFLSDWFYWYRMISVCGAEGLNIVRHAAMTTGVSITRPCGRVVSVIKKINTATSFLRAVYGRPTVVCFSYRRISIRRWNVYNASRRLDKKKKKFLANMKLLKCTGTLFIIHPKIPQFTAILSEQLNPLSSYVRTYMYKRRDTILNPGPINGHITWAFLPLGLLYIITNTKPRRLDPSSHTTWARQRTTRVLMDSVTVLLLHDIQLAFDWLIDWLIDSRWKKYFSAHRGKNRCHGTNRGALRSPFSRHENRPVVCLLCMQCVVVFVC